MANKKGSIYQTKPTRLWFLVRDLKQADTRYTKGRVIWLHPQTNDVLNQYGQKIKLRVAPKEKFKKNATRYLALSRGYGDMLLARLKYLTFIGPIPKGKTIDHIDGNPLNNDINNLRAIPDAINRRDGGFLRKLRNHGIIVADYQATTILEGYKRMAIWKAEHSVWKYRQLDRADLLLIFLGKEDQL